MNIKIFDPSDIRHPISDSVIDVEAMTPDLLLRKFHNKPSHLQAMWLDDNGRLGSMNMLDESYSINLSNTIEHMINLLKQEVAVVIKTSDFEIFCHGQLIEKSIYQVENIINWKQWGLLDPYSPNNYKDYLVLDNNYFFTSEKWNSEKFINYLTD